MENQFDKKITLTIKKFSSSLSDTIYSDSFVLGGCKWHLEACSTKLNSSVAHFPFSLAVANPMSLSSGWKRHIKIRITLIYQWLTRSYSTKDYDIENWFDEKSPHRGFNVMCLLDEIHDKDSRCLLIKELNFVIEIKVLEVIGKLDVTDETSTITENVHGFKILPCQAKLVSHMFESHPEIASDIHLKNSNLRTSYMSLLLSLIETIRYLPQNKYKDDVYDAYVALGFLKDVGFKLDWLEKKLEKVSEKMEDEEASEVRLQKMEDELKDLMEKYSDMQFLVNKEKAKMSAAKTSISFDDVVA